MSHENQNGQAENFKAEASQKESVPPISLEEYLAKERLQSPCSERTKDAILELGSSLLEPMHRRDTEQFIVEWKTAMFNLIAIVKMFGLPDMDLMLFIAEASGASAGKLKNLGLGPRE